MASLLSNNFQLHTALCNEGQYCTIIKHITPAKLFSHTDINMVLYGTSAIENVYIKNYLKTLHSTNNEIMLMSKEELVSLYEFCLIMEEENDKDISLQ
jgi:hypothetical protein